MLAHPQIDPVAFSVFGFSVHWYGLAYLTGLGCAWALGKARARRRDFADLGLAREGALVDLLFAAFAGAVIGGRMGYMIFYRPDWLLDDPLALFRLWQGGMSFHGGLAGAIVGICWFARRAKIPILRALDFCAPLTAPGLGLGRVANFVNGELWGRAADPDLPWAMVFSHVDDTPRHPSQLYQAGMEGALLFALVWLYSRRPRPAGATAGLFVIGYAAARFAVEFFREPDAHLGLQALALSRGQWLTLPMFAFGAFLWLRARSNPLPSRKNRARDSGRDAAKKGAARKN